MTPVAALYPVIVNTPLPVSAKVWGSVTAPLPKSTTPPTLTVCTPASAPTVIEPSTVAPVASVTEWWPGLAAPSSSPMPIVGAPSVLPWMVMTSCAVAVSPSASVMV